MFPDILVFGAAGHTGRFVVAELRRRGSNPIVAGRDGARLAAAHPTLEARVADVADAAALEGALRGCRAVINCAGPFLDTAAPLIEAALRAGAHYLDVTAEQASARSTFERFAEPAERAGVTVVPAMGFYGGLGDLLATAAMGKWTEADEIAVAVALDRWWPTEGTRLTGKRNTFRRQVVENGRLTDLADPPPTRTWTLPAPFGVQSMASVPFSEIITISRHLRSREVHSFMNLAALQDVRNPDTPPPAPADERGRSAQIFVVEVVARNGDRERGARARGQDIYAVTAPLIVEATARIVAGPRRAGALPPGALFDARDFLLTLAPEALLVELF